LTGLELGVAHVFARTHQQACWIRQCRAVKEAQIDVRLEDPDVCEWDVLDTDRRIAVVHQFKDVAPAVPDGLEPRRRQDAKLSGMPLKPAIDGRVMLDGASKGQQRRHAQPGIRIRRVIDHGRSCSV
jgi:hypothetical protein